MDVFNDLIYKIPEGISFIIEETDVKNCSMSWQCPVEITEDGMYQVLNKVKYDVHYEFNNSTFVKSLLTYKKIKVLFHISNDAIIAYEKVKINEISVKKRNLSFTCKKRINLTRKQYREAKIKLLEIL